MISCNKIILAKQIIIDGASNEISIISMFEVLSAKKLPVTLASSDLLLMLEKGSKSDQDLQNFTIKVNIGSKTVLEGKFEINFQGKKNARNRIYCITINIKKKEPLSIKLFNNKRKIAQLNIPVVVENNE